jgi:tetratricopeptide (TPR) repeat protein
MDTVTPLLDRAERGRGQVLGVVGEPGVGKSRFVFELTRSGHLRGWRVLGCSAVSHGTARVYLPILDLLRSYFELDDAEERVRLRERVTEKVRALGAGLEAHVPALLALLDLPVDDAAWHGLDPAYQRRRRLEAVKRLLLRESQAQPLLLVVEDLHWSDSETQAALEALEEGLPAARLLLLVTCRPGYRHDWGSKTYYTQLRLDPLPPDGAAELLRRLMGEDESLRTLAALVADRTEGNALFLEETVRMLVETGVVDGAPGAYHLIRPVETIQVPATVQALLAARIDRLPPGERQLLQSAAVIGRDLPLDLLRAVAGVSDDEALRLSLQRLQAAEFLYEVSLFGELGYTFKHALTHEVAYESLPGDERRALHARCVEAIQALYADRLNEQTEQLAHHAVRGELWDPALAFSRQAGQRASARCAFREAAAAFEQALVALDHLPRTREAIERAIDLRFELRQVLQPTWEHERNRRHLEAAERLANDLQDRRRLGRVLVYRSTMAFLDGDPGGAVALSGNALEIAEALGDIELEVIATVHLGAPYYSLGEHRRAAAFLERAVDGSGGERLHERMGLAHVASVLSRSWLVRCLAELGEFDEGVRLGQEAMQIADAAGHPISQVAARLAVGAVELGRGELPTAILTLEEALEIERRYHGSNWLPHVQAVLGYAYVLARRAADGFSLLERAGGPPRHGQALRAAWLAEAHLSVGRIDQAQRLADEALALAGDLHERGHEAWARRLRGEIASRCDPPNVDQAEGHYRQAMTLAAELGMRPLVAHCHLGLGKLYRRVAPRHLTRQQLTTAATLYREMAMGFYLAQAEAALDQVG